MNGFIVRTERRRNEIDLNDMLGYCFLKDRCDDMFVASEMKAQGTSNCIALPWLGDVRRRVLEDTFLQPRRIGFPQEMAMVAAEAQMPRLVPPEVLRRLTLR